MNNYYKHQDEFIKMLLAFKNSRSDMKLVSEHDFLHKLNDDFLRSLYYIWFGRNYYSDHKIQPEVIKKIKQTDAKITVHDPLLPRSRKILGFINLPFEEAVKGADCLVFMSDHDVFKKINITKLKKIVKKSAVIIDGRNIFKPCIVVKNGFLYRGVGRTYTSINNSVRNI